jgi:hypothetical protein
VASSHSERRVDLFEAQLSKPFGVAQSLICGAGMPDSTEGKRPSTMSLVNVVRFLAPHPRRKMGGYLRHLCRNRLLQKTLSVMVLTACHTLQ